VLLTWVFLGWVLLVIWGDGVGGILSECSQLGAVDLGALGLGGSGWGVGVGGIPLECSQLGALGLGGSGWGVGVGGTPLGCLYLG